MNARSLVALCALVVVACAPRERSPDSDGTWVGTITTEGSITTVVNEAGSAWGGTARLVEEASIGVDAGEQWYMFGRIVGVAASNERIYVIDGSVPVVRAYSIDGAYYGDLGRAGQGPGEYELPVGIEVAEDGRVFVLDRIRRRVSIYTATGDYIGGHGLLFDMGPWNVPMVVTEDGTTYGGVVGDPDAAYDRASYGMRAHGPEGPYGDTLLPPPYDVEAPYIGAHQMIIPHAPHYVWAMDSQLRLIAGFGRDYHFTIARPDGTTLIVEREFEPIAIAEEEREQAIRSVTESIRRSAGEAWTWDGPPVPRFKAAFVAFMPTHSGELWVIRPGRSELIEASSGGEPTSFWRPTYIVDAFAADGRFLGEVAMPPGARGWIEGFASNHAGRFAFVRGDTVIMPTEDAAGTIMVKRYQLVLPHEG